MVAPCILEEITLFSLFSLQQPWLSLKNYISEVPQNYSQLCCLLSFFVPGPTQWTWGTRMQTTLSEVFPHFGVPSQHSSICDFHKGFKLRLTPSSLELKEVTAEGRNGLHSIGSVNASSIVGPRQYVTPDNDSGLFCYSILQRVLLEKFQCQLLFLMHKCLLAQTPKQCGNKTFTKTSAFSNLKIIES